MFSRYLGNGVISQDLEKDLAELKVEKPASAHFA